jgi:hypothetical protein
LIGTKERRLEGRGSIRVSEFGAGVQIPQQEFVPRVAVVWGPFRPPLNSHQLQFVKYSVQCRKAVHIFSDHHPQLVSTWGTHTNTHTCAVRRGPPGFRDTKLTPTHDNLVQSVRRRTSVGSPCCYVRFGVLSALTMKGTIFMYHISLRVYRGYLKMVQNG